MSSLIFKRGGRAILHSKSKPVRQISLRPSQIPFVTQTVVPGQDIADIIGLPANGVHIHGRGPEWLGVLGFKSLGLGSTAKCSGHKVRGLGQEFVFQV